MSEWKEYKLGDIAEIVGGGTPDTSKIEYWGGDIPWLTPKDLTGYNKIFISKGERSITEEGLKNSSTKLLPKGTVLLSSRAPIGYVAIASNSICTNQGFKSIVCNPDIIDNKYMYYWIKNNTEMLQSLGTGTTFAEISGSVVKSIDILLPPLEKQKRIASILSSLDDKIDLLHRENATLEAMAETLFRQWFIEEAKEDWEEMSFGEVIEIFDSKRKPLSKMERDKMKNGSVFYPYYGAAEIMDYIDSYLFDGEFILMGEDGTVKTDDGYPILQYASGKFWSNNHAHVLQAKPPYNNCFIWYYLKTTNIEYIVTGAVQPKINQANLLSLPFYKYPYDLLKKYKSVTQEIWEKVMKNKEQIKILMQMRNDLLNKLISNEIDIV